jgi:ribonuclease-3
VETHVLANAVPELHPLSPGEQFSSTVGDHKSALQEMLQAQSRPKPEYRLVEESGPDHKRLFRVEVWVDGAAVAGAEGTTKKQAQQEAARLAVAALMARAPR